MSTASRFVSALALRWAVPLGLVLAPQLAHADAIMPFDGECFPGSREGISHHREACIPIACESDADCGDEASCRELCTCRAERDVFRVGRRMTEIGLCDPQGQCPEGDVVRRRQCEPLAPTDGFDPALHAWTGRTHRPVSAPPEPETQVEVNAPSDRPPAESPRGGCAGCSVSAPRPGRVGLWGAGLALLFWRRRAR